MFSVCTRLHAIGFPCEIDRATADCIARIAATPTRRISCAAGEYRIWRSAGGAEIWLHFPLVTAAAAAPSKGGVPVLAPAPAAPRVPPRPVPPPPRRDERKAFDAIDDLKGMTIFHRGQSDIRVKLDRSLGIAKENPLDGVCLAYLEDRTGRGRPAPLAFEHLGFAADPAARPGLARVQITGLAQKIWAYPTETAYLASTPSKRLIGRGALTMVEPEEVADAGLIYTTKPATLWLVTGVVRRSIRLTNPLTGTSYVWLLLATDRGEIDVIANPAVIAGDISDGHTVQTVVSMTGRIIERIGTP